jgi:hypothetical protein
MKNYLTKQKPQILTAQFIAIYILTNFILNLIN